MSLSAVLAGRQWVSAGGSGRSAFNGRLPGSTSPVQSRTLRTSNFQSIYRRSVTRSSADLRRMYSTEDSSSNCKCKGREIVIPTPKRKVLTKTTSNTSGDAPKTAPAEATTANTIDKTAEAAPEDKNSTKKEEKPNKAPKQAPGELPVSSDEEAFSLLSSFGKYLWPSSWKLRWRVGGAVSLLVASKLVNIQVPMLFKTIVDSMTEVSQAVSGAATNPEIFGTLAANVDPNALGLAAMATIMGYGIARSTASLFHELRSVIFSPVAQQAIRQVATQTFLHLHAMDLNWHLSRQTGGISRAVDRGTRGIQQVLNAMLFTLVPTGLEIALVSGLLWSQFGFKFAALTMGTVGLYGIYTFLMTKWRTKFRIEMNKLDNQAATVALDSLMNYETVKYFTNEKLEVDRYESVLKKYDDAQLKTTSSLALLNWGQNLVFSGALATGMIMAAHGISSGVMTVGDIVLINGLLLQLAQPLGFLGSTYRETRQALIDMSTMFKLLDLRSAISDKPGAVQLRISKYAGALSNCDKKSVILENSSEKGKSGEISFENVHFGYSDESSILKGVNFTVPAGKKVAVVGSSGGGKSTLLRLLYRFYDADQGTVRIDGQDLKNVTIDSLRKSIGVVPQDLVLFNETIFYNIKYGDTSATDEEVYEAARKANVHEQILRMPEGYNTPVGERGLKLSGGEKQRICLARALLKNPPILILDEATSSLDSESEAAVQVAIDNAVGGGRTVLMISHRLKTVHNADKIVVLNGGKIVEEGTHSSLMAIRGHYFSLVQNQNLSDGKPATPAEESDVSL